MKFILAAAVLAFLAANAGKSEETMEKPPGELPRYDLLRATGPITVDGVLDEKDWQAAKSVGDFVFPWWTAGEKEQTVAKMLWDNENLYIAFQCQDKWISAQVTQHDGRVCEDDCVEIFTAPNPDRLQDYFNLEFNALGTFLDARPGEKRDYAWNAEGLQVAIKIDGTLNDDSDIDRGWVCELAIPFKNFAGYAQHVPPQEGDIWRLNLNRCGGKTNLQYSQWSASPTPKPQFHAPEGFGMVRFLMSKVR